MSRQPEPIPRRESVLSVQLDVFEELYEAVYRADRDERGFRLVEVHCEGSDDRLFVVDTSPRTKPKAFAQTREEAKKALEPSVFAWSEGEAKKALEPSVFAWSEGEAKKALEGWATERRERAESTATHHTGNTTPEQVAKERGAFRDFLNGGYNPRRSTSPSPFRLSSSQPVESVEGRARKCCSHCPNCIVEATSKAIPTGLATPATTVSVARTTASLARTTTASTTPPREKRRRGTSHYPSPTKATPTPAGATGANARLRASKARVCRDSEDEDEDEEDTEEDVSDDTRGDHDGDDAEEDVGDNIEEDCDGDGDGDGDDEEDGDEDAVVAMPVRKKRRTGVKARPARSTKRSEPPKVSKTKKGTLKTTMTAEESAERRGVTPPPPSTQPTIVGYEVDGDSTATSDEQDTSTAIPEGQGTGTPIPDGQKTAVTDSSDDAEHSLEDAPQPETSMRAPVPSHPFTASTAEQANPNAVLPLRTPTTPSPPSTEPIPDPVRPSVAAEGLPIDRCERRGSLAPEDSTAEEKRLYRTFCAGVEAAKGVYMHSSTIGALKRLQGEAGRPGADPGLWRTFRRCFAVARATAGEGAAARWKAWLTSCREGGDALATAAAITIPNPTSREVAIAACREIRVASRAETGTWLLAFHYRRALVRLTAQCDLYADLPENRHPHEATTLRRSRPKALRALFNEMVACGQGGSSLSWSSFNKAEGEGQRWRILTDRLGLGILLLLEIPDGDVRFFTRDAPMSVLAAWAKLIPSVVLGVDRAAAMAERHYNAIEGDPDLALPLPYLKLEISAYDACPTVERWDECEEEPAIDPRYLIRTSDGAIAGHGSGTDEQLEQWDGDVADDDLCDAAELVMRSQGAPC